MIVRPRRRFCSEYNSTPALANNKERADHDLVRGQLESLARLCLRSVIVVVVVVAAFGNSNAA
jgi:hypothetical protein